MKALSLSHLAAARRSGSGADVDPGAGINTRPSSLTSLPPDEVLDVLRAARASARVGATSRCGAYGAGALPSARWRGGLQSLVPATGMVLAVVLAGVFLFPLDAHADRSRVLHRPGCPVAAAVL
jgi:hypothetical protein